MANPVSQTVHRCRFVEYQPNTINCIAVQTHPASSASADLDERFAVARSNGDIEIWNSTSNWHIERVIPGAEGISVEQIVWFGNRLFTAGLHSMITEWNVSKMRVETVVDSFGGSVWCISMNKAGTMIAAGCEDGSIKILDITDDTLVFVRSLDRQEGRILSLDWSEDGNTIVSGASDSTIRIWNVERGKCKLRITVQTEKKDEPALVWTVKVLPDSTIVSGDSLGKTQFWDGKFGTLLQSFAQHEADVLVTAVSSDSNTVYASGVDNKLIQISKLAEATTSSKAGEWVLSGRSRDHTHDVRALALSPNGSVVSGGLDTNLIVYQKDQFGSHGCIHRKIPPFPQNKIIANTTKSNLLVYHRDRSLKIWQLGTAAETDSDEPEHESDRIRIGTGPRLLVELNSQSTGNIISSSISADGTLLTYSNMVGTRIFKVTVDPESDGLCHLARVKGFKDDLLIAHSSVFTSDGSTLLLASTDEHLQVINVTQSTVMATLKVPTDKDEQRNACLVATNSDGKWAVVSYGSRFHIYNLDTLQYHGSTPSFGSVPSAVSFTPTSPTIVVTCVNNKIYVYDVEKQRQTDWSKTNSNALPLQFEQKQEKTISICFDPANSNKAFFQDHSGVYVVDFSQALPSRHDQLTQIGGNAVRNKDSRKRSKEEGFQTKKEKAKKLKIGSSNHSKSIDATPTSSSDNFKIIKKYQPLLFFGVSEANALVVVERPWVSVMQNLPPPLLRKKYGV